jgi:hypothetical protein
LGFGPADDRIASPPPGSHRESLLYDIGSAECQQRCGYHENCSPYLSRYRMELCLDILDAECDEHLCLLSLLVSSIPLSFLTS